MRRHIVNLPFLAPSLVLITKFEVGGSVADTRSQCRLRRLIFKPASCPIDVVGIVQSNVRVSGGRSRAGMMSASYGTITSFGLDHFDLLQSNRW